MYPGVWGHHSYQACPTHPLVLDWQAGWQEYPSHSPWVGWCVSGQQLYSNNARDASLGQKGKRVAAPWPGRQAAGFEVPGGICSGWGWESEGATCRPPQAWLCLLTLPARPGLLCLMSGEAGGGEAHWVGGGGGKESFEGHLSTFAEPEVLLGAECPPGLSPEEPVTALRWKETPRPLPSRCSA